MTLKKPAADHRKSGQPTRFKPEFVEQAYKLCLLGATDAQMASFFGVAEASINAWKHAHPTFLESITRGKLLADAEIAEALFHRARGYSHSATKIFMPAMAAEPVYAAYVERFPPDTQAASLWLRNRQPKLWRDKLNHEVTGVDGGPIAQITATMTAEQAAAIYRARLMASD